MERQYANRFMFSDVIPFEVVWKVSDKTLDIRQMAHKRAPDHGGPSAQSWVITSDPGQTSVRIRLTKRGWRCSGGHRYELSDTPMYYYDYGF